MGVPAWFRPQSLPSAITAAGLLAGSRTPTPTGGCAAHSSAGNAAGSVALPRPETRGLETLGDSNDHMMYGLQHGDRGGFCGPTGGDELEWNQTKSGTYAVIRLHRDNVGGWLATALRLQNTCVPCSS